MIYLNLAPPYCLLTTSLFVSLTYRILFNRSPCPLSSSTAAAARIPKILYNPTSPKPRAWIPTSVTWYEIYRNLEQTNQISQRRASSKKRNMAIGEFEAKNWISIPRQQPAKKSCTRASDPPIASCKLWERNQVEKNRRNLIAFRSA